MLLTRDPGGLNIRPHRRDDRQLGRGFMALSSRLVLAALVGLSIVVGCYQAVLFGLGYSVGAPFQAIYSLVFVLLLIVWIDLDCRGREDIYRPFEFDFLIFVFWLPYLPYYLLRTRRARGLLWLLGLFLLFHVGYFLQWLVYFAR
ncbi:hypothetical protein [Dyella jiangningensis]|nr:hypothetical protein [Dyella jiangningensis]